MNVVKLRILRSSWVIWVKPKFSEKCPYKRTRGEDRHRKEGGIKTKAELRVTRPQAREAEDSQPTQSWKTQGSIVLCSLQRDNGFVNTLILDFRSPELRSNKFMLF